MGTTSKIEWTDATWNPIIGCSRVSEGCRNCYAETIAGRFGNGKPTVYSGLTQIVNGRAVWTGEIKETRQLLQPLSWRPGRPIYDATTGKKVGRDPSQSLRIFVNSMSDLFHENVTDEMRDRIFAVMALCPQHTFQVLTKRPDRMLAYCTDDATLGRMTRAADGIARELGGRAIMSCWQVDDGLTGITLPNVWLGVSVENQAAADTRIPLLLKTPAAVRFISAEPLLGPVDLFHYVGNGSRKPNLDWVITGGESGPNARPMHPDWARNMRDECVVAGVPFFFKQWGEWLPAMTDGATTERELTLNCSDDPVRVGKKAAGDLLDGREWREFPNA